MPNLKGIPEDLREDWARNGVLGILNPLAKYGDKQLDSSYKAAVTKGIREAYSGDKEALHDISNANKRILKA